MSMIFAPGETDPYRNPELAFAARRDLFPAEVTVTVTPTATAPTTTAVTFAKTRVIIGAEDIYVFSDGPRGPVLVFYDRMDDLDLPTVTTTEATLTVTPTNGCGCGSRLRGFRPFGSLTYLPTR
jgi:hypothetical protein